MPIEKPKTIEELKQWYEEHNLPSYDITRFFIGVNYQQPRAFGIYQDGDRYVVYKNKNDGSRAIRYQGPDEAYAVNELWMKLKEEILRQKANQPGSSSSANTKSSGCSGKVIGIVFAVFMLLCFLINMLATSRPSSGYYRYDVPNAIYQNYYYLDGNWYYYAGQGGSNGWKKTTQPPAELTEHWKDYYKGNRTHTSGYGVSDFFDTTYYTDYQDRHSSSSDSYSWDSSDSWDSGGMDFDSDW